MNLTSKRMLQFLTVCAGACALTASAQATRWIDDNFEAEGTGYTNAQINQLAGTYKMAVWGVQSENTNLLWFASSEDASKIVSNLVSYTDRTPLQGSTTAQCLELNTEGQTLSRAVVVGGVTGSVPFSSSLVYMDTLIKFTPSEDDPTIEPGVKVAFWVDVNSNLVMRHKTTADGLTYFETNSVFTSLGKINPEQWYRLTIKMVGTSPFSFTPACQVFWNGNPAAVSHPNAITTSWALNGTYFILLNTDRTISQVSFQGTGSVDELVLADQVDLTPLTGLQLTLAFEDAFLDVFVDSAAVTNGQQIASGSAVTMNTIEWYQLNSITGTGITTDVTDGEIGGNMKTNAVVEITAGEAGLTATINVGQYTGTISTGLVGSYSNVPADKLSAWAVSSGLSINDVIANADDYLDNYLLNVDETTTATLKITSIVFDGAKATITIAADTSNELDPVDLTAAGLNGTLVVWTTDDLAGSWGVPDTYTITARTSSSVTIEVPVLKGKFIKARVE